MARELVKLELGCRMAIDLLPALEMKERRRDRLAGRAITDFVCLTPG